MHYTYILLLDNRTLYTGSTADIKRKISEHRSKKVTSTAFSDTHTIVHMEMYVLKSDAQRRERFLKTTEGKRLLRQQLRDILLQHNIRN